jgi:pilus assembly protein FimV
MDELTEVDEILDDIADDFAVEEDEQADIPTMDEVASEDEFDVAAEMPELASEDFSEEESFVSNLLNDMDVAEDDQDVIPEVGLEESIEESLSDSDLESDFGDLEVPDFGVEEANESAEVDDEEEDIDFFDASGDEVATKLDLARAYMDMGDEEGARVILEDVLNVGNESQIAEAQSRMERMFPGE